MIDLSNDLFLVDEDGNVTEEPVGATMWHGDHPEIDRVVIERGWDLSSMMPVDVMALPPGMMYHVPPKRPSGGPAFVYASLASNPALIQLQKDVASYLAGHGTVLGLQKPEHFHITLLYIENVDDDDLVKLLEAFNPPAQFKVRGVTLGTFDEADDKPVVLKLAGTPPLMRLQRTLYERALSMDLNVSEYSKPSQYKPHITLAMNMDPPDAEIIQMQRGLDLWIDSIVLGRDDYQTQRVIMLPALVGGQTYILRGGPTVPLPEPPSDRDYQNAVVRALSRLRDAVYKVVRGGEGSGNFGHAGRPGQRGGSAPGSGGAATSAKESGSTYSAENMADNSTSLSPAELEDRFDSIFGPVDQSDFESIVDSAYIGPSGRFFAYGEDHAEAAREVLGLDAGTGEADAVRKLTSGAGFVRHTAFQGQHGFTLPDKPTSDQRSSIIRLMDYAKATTHGPIEFYFDTLSNGLIDPIAASDAAALLGLDGDFYDIGTYVIRFVERGGPGSGHHGHEGRPGEVGGSKPGDGGAPDKTDQAQAAKPAEAPAQQEAVSHPDQMRQYRQSEYDSLQERIASGEEIWRIPKEEFANEIKDIGGEEGFLRRAERDDVWKDQMLKALSEGKISVDDAKALGYYPLGGEEWKPLPETLYHVTTSLSGVKAEGLKSRADLQQDGGTGLGGGDDTSISFTADPKIADSIYASMIEAQKVASGQISAKDMLDQAARGEGADREYLSGITQRTDGKLTPGLQDLVDGKARDRAMWTTEEAFNAKRSAESYHPTSGWKGVGDSREIEGKGTVYMEFVRDLTPDEVQDRTFDLYKRFNSYRQYAGGRMDPMFFLTNVKALSATDPGEIAITKWKPAEGGMGYVKSALGEWRTHSGKAVNFDGAVNGMPPEKSPKVDSAFPEKARLGDPGIRSWAQIVRDPMTIAASGEALNDPTQAVILALSNPSIDIGDKIIKVATGPMAGDWKMHGDSVSDMSGRKESAKAMIAGIEGEKAYLIPDDHNVDSSQAEGQPVVRGLLRRVDRGGPGSGHHGHEGRPGERGGSKPASGGSGSDGGQDSGQDSGQTPGQNTGQSGGQSGGQATGQTEAPSVQSGTVALQLAQAPVKQYQFKDDDPFIDTASKIYAEQSPEVMARVNEARRKIKEGQTTQDMYKDPETGEYTPERQKLHEQIINQVMANVKPQDGEPEFIMTGGYPGAGKSSLFKALEEGGESFANYVHVDSDAIKGMLPEYEGWNAALTHQEASDIVDEVVSRAANQHLNLIYDATMKTAENTKAIVGAFEDHGYHSRVMYVDVPIEEAMRRAMARFANHPNGRFVDLNYIATHDHKNIHSLEVVKGVADEWEQWNNNVPRGNSPILMAKGKRQ